MPDVPIRKILQSGVVIPAHPLALTSNRKLDEVRQRGLTRYYIASGVGGIAVGVHTTQFEIRDPQIGLFKPVLELAGETIENSDLPIVKISGICGKTKQAVSEAQFAAEIGYDAGLLSVGALKTETVDQLIDHCKAIAEVIPVIGFYLQPSVGGRILSYDFWRRFAEIPNVIAIKIAPFNRYQTIDVVRAIAEAGRTNEIALYTGNDDNIILDLLTTFKFRVAGKPVCLRIVGGLLGHWAVWTKRAVEMLQEIHRVVESGSPIPPELLTLAIEVTDANAAFFDPANRFAGCIAGIHEVLRRSGLMQGRWCLNPAEELSPRQMEEIDRVYAAYPHLNDDTFVSEHIDDWLR